MSNTDVQDLAQYGQHRADDVVDHDPGLFGVPVVTAEGLDGLEGAAALLASQVVESALEETESSQMANQSAVEEDGPTELDGYVEEECEGGDKKEEEEQDYEEEENDEKRNPNEEVQEEEDDVSSLSSVSSPWLDFGHRFLGSGPFPSMHYPS